MEKKIYSGAYLLEYSNRKKQFGTVDASYHLSEKARFMLRKEDLSNVFIDDDFISFEVSLEQLEIMSKTTRSVFEAIVLLKQLANRDKLRDNAFLNDSDERI